MRCKEEKKARKAKKDKSKKDKLMASLFNTGCAFQGRGAGDRSQHSEITLTVEHLS
jgi:hypothetical protein